MSAANLRKVWIGGNWKCNGGKALTSEICKIMVEALESPNEDVVVFPTYLDISDAILQLGGKCAVGAQNCSKTNEGAFTGEISIKILKDRGVSWVLCGHSERRQLYGEDDICVAEKVKQVQSQSVGVVLCIGETKQEREDGKTLEVCLRQLSTALPSISDWTSVVIAYEPVWAIGTGLVATPSIAEEVHEEIRNFLNKEVSVNVAAQTRIVYGGSVNENNCSDLISMPNVDGFLVGGASLKAGFSQILKKSIS